MQNFRWISGLKVGQLVPGEGIYMGYITLPVCEAKKTFAVFAAPEDFPMKLTFDSAKKEGANIRNLYGHDGAAFSYGYGILEEIAHRGPNSCHRIKYMGQWVLPPPEIVLGGVHSDNSSVVGFYEARDLGAFKGTFKCGEADGGALYLTSTADPKWKPAATPYNETSQKVQDTNDKADLIVIDFLDGSVVPVRRDEVPAWCRFVRFKEIACC